MVLYFATTNEGKVKSLRKDLKKYGIQVSQMPIELNEPRSGYVQEIAESKIKEAYARIQKPTIVLDAGFCIDDLKDFPGTFVNFTLQTIGLDGILRLIENRSRGCEFRECLAYLDYSMEKPKFITTGVRGQLAETKRGSMQAHLWSKLGLIFIPDGSEKTIAEMSREEYLKWREISRKDNSPGQKLYEWLSKHEKHMKQVLSKS